MRKLKRKGILPVAAVRGFAFLLPLFVYLLFCNCAIGRPITKDDLVGTYHVDVSGAEDPQTIPTNFYAVVLVLKSDGSFVTTNATKEFFFPYPSHDTGAEVTHGTWEFSHDLDDEGGQLDLNFSAGSWGGDWSHGVELYHGAPRILMSYHPFKHSRKFFNFYLTRQTR